MTDEQQQLLDAMGHKDTKAVKALLAASVSPKGVSEYDENILVRAFYRSNKAIVKALIPTSDMSEKSKRGLSLMHMMAEHMRDPKIATLLLDAGAELNGLDEDKRTPLFNAVKASKIDLAALLIERGCDINARDDEELTPLLYVLKSESGELNKKEIAMAKGLIELGADVSARNENGSGALHFAASDGDLELVEFLADKGATPDADKFGGTPLHYCIGTRSFEPDLWQKLIDLGCSIEDKGHGDSALMRAVVNHNDKAVKWFLEKGADKNSTNDDGQTVLEYATHLGRQKAIKLLS